MMTPESYQRRILELVEENIYYRQSAARGWLYATLALGLLVVAFFTRGCS